MPLSVDEMILIPGACVHSSVEELTLTQGACVPLSVWKIALIPGAGVFLRKDEMISILEAFLQMSLNVEDMALIPGACVPLSMEETILIPGTRVLVGLSNNNNVHLSCAYQRPERSHDTY